MQTCDLDNKDFFSKSDRPLVSDCFSYKGNGWHDLIGCRLTNFKLELVVPFCLNQMHDMIAFSGLDAFQFSSQASRKPHVEDAAGYPSGQSLLDYLRAVDLTGVVIQLLITLHYLHYVTWTKWNSYEIWQADDFIFNLNGHSTEVGVSLDGNFRAYCKLCQTWLL
ncbi:hypothetical protein SELMODRAFT_417921 [Selaginella moellendorffii]|uniref:Uncharacterized protein n=1 Tax=Selaginella moellendorffii TaxID=88036 RepID=D8S435_SELML|nr:hypothetical protein SELMODRAFT_417921 [Selaginella moellendorffii]